MLSSSALLDIPCHMCAANLLRVGKTTVFGLFTACKTMDLKCITDLKFLKDFTYNSETLNRMKSWCKMVKAIISKPNPTVPPEFSCLQHQCVTDAAMTRLAWAVCGELKM